MNWHMKPMQAICPGDFLQGLGTVTKLEPYTGPLLELAGAAIATFNGAGYVGRITLEPHRRYQVKPCQ